MSRGRAPGDGEAPGPGTELESSMPFAVDRALLGLLNAPGRERGDPGRMRRIDELFLKHPF